MILHADRGSRMTSTGVDPLRVDMGVAKTHARPYVCNDNPYSEAQFKTLKYRPDFPALFGSIEDAMAFCRPFFDWYNSAHYHSGIALLTPHSVHTGQATQIVPQRNQVLPTAFEPHPLRFKGKMPTAKPVPEAAWINPPSNLSPSKETPLQETDIVDAH